MNSSSLARLLRTIAGAGVGRLAISERQLRRRFERTIGLRPWSYARIARVQRAVRLALQNGWTWTAVAYEAGFSDQAHLAREVRALTGYRRFD